MVNPVMRTENARFRWINIGIVILFIPILVCGQYDLEIGNWKSYLSGNVGKAVAVSKDKVFYATENGLMTISKEDLALDYFSKVDGLSDLDIKHLYYIVNKDVLFIAYDNTNIDLVYNDSIVNFSNILTNPYITGEKEINHVMYDGGQYLYLSCSFGLVQFNLGNNTFGFTLFMDNPVNATAVVENRLTMLSSDQVFHIDRTGNPNYEDLNSWAPYSSSDGFPESAVYTTISSYTDQLYIVKNDSLFKMKDGGLFFVYFDPDYSFTFLNGEGQFLKSGMSCITGCSDKVLFFNELDEIKTANANCVSRTLNAVEDDDGNIYFADRWRDFRLSTGPEDYCDRILPNGIYSDRLSEIFIDEEGLYIASGGVSTNYFYTYNDHGLFVLKQGEWTYFNRSNRAEFKDPEVLDFFRVRKHPSNGKIYVGTFYAGLVEIADDSITIYDDSNSSLQGKTGEEFRTRIGGMEYDEDENLWIGNHWAERPISVMKNDGTWQNFKAGNTNFLSELAIDNYGNKWFALTSTNEGVLVFNEGEMDIDEDDQYHVFTKTNSNLTTNKVNCIKKDLNGNIWVGTAEGPVVFGCGNDVFEDICIGNRPKIAKDSLFEYLLSYEDIRSIAVDGGNRKWIGTTNGVFLVSPDGQEEIARFNSDNSPLFDDLIKDIIVHPDNGEVFMATEKGLISYRSEATEATIRHKTNIYAFPNPVRPDYQGPIAINGLARDALIKITDIKGQLIFETIATGGQAIWDGRDYNGRRASSGVYLVFSSHNRSDRKPDAAVTKILVVN